MYCTTRGIIIHSTQYNDNYSIVHVYTALYGRVSYLVARQRKRKTNVSNAHFMPLTLVEMEVEHQKTREIQRIKEIRIHYPLVSIPAHPVKNAVALFLSEILYRIIQTTESDPKLFEYLCNSIRYLEILDQGIANFHLVFLIHLARYLGIYPNAESYAPDVYFDLLNGIFTPQTPTHPHYLKKDESIIFFRLLRMNYENMALYTFSRKERTRIIQQILEYFRLHSIIFPEIKSLNVLHSLFD
jgi:DNA repair protein RecO (recombination protein O)